MSNENWMLKNSNDQTSGWKAALSFPGNLWWILPLIFIGSIGYDYWASAYDHKPFHPVWLRAVACAIFGGLFIGWLIGVIRSEKRR